MARNSWVIMFIPSFIEARSVFYVFLIPRLLQKSLFQEFHVRFQWAKMPCFQAISLVSLWFLCRMRSRKCSVYEAFELIFVQTFMKSFNPNELLQLSLILQRFDEK